MADDGVKICIMAWYGFGVMDNVMSDGSQETEYWPRLGPGAQETVIELSNRRVSMLPRGIRCVLLEQTFCRNTHGAARYKEMIPILLASFIERAV